MTAGMDCLHSSECMCLTELSVEKPFFQLCMHLIVKDKSLVGTVKETIMQVSSSKKWISKPTLDEDGNPVLNSKGKPILRKSYSVLQDDFFNAMRTAGYTDVERGERGSTEEHLTVTQFKVQQEAARLEVLEAQTERKEGEFEKGVQNCE